ncbi:hypothetical protein JOQ06_012755, partial [Pogonophryne albipinna]
MMSGKHFKAHEVSCCIKYFIFGFNIIFWFLGLAFLGIGLWAWNEKGVLSNISSITDLGGFDPVWLFLVVGGVMFVLGFAGCIGALRENSFLLKFFSVFLGIIFFLELTAGVLAFVFKDWIKDQLNFFINNNIRAYRDDIDLQNLIDFTQEYWECCGAFGADDWNLNIYFNCTDTNPSREKCGVPFSCCTKDPAPCYLHPPEGRLTLSTIMAAGQQDVEASGLTPLRLCQHSKVEKRLGGEDVINTQCGYDIRAKPDSEQRTFIYIKGCVPQFEKWLQENLTVVAGIFIGIALLQTSTETPKGKKDVPGLCLDASTEGNYINQLCPKQRVLFTSSSVTASAKGGAAGPRLNNDQLYKFSYSTEVLVDRVRGSKEGTAGYRISSDVDVNLVWRDTSNKDDQLIQLAISNVRIEPASQRSKKKNVLHGSTAESLLGKTKLAALTKPFFLHLKNGKAKAFYSFWAEPATIKNLKRGLASLLQMQRTTGKVIENDVSGRCTVEYKAVKGQVTRTKVLDTCKTAETGFTTFSQVLGVGRKSSSVTTFTLEDGFIHSAVAEETHSLAVNSRRSAAAKVVSRQTLTLVGTEAGPLEAAGTDVAEVVKSIDAKLAAVGIIADKVKSKCKGCPTLFEHWQSEQKQLEPASLSKATAPRSFLALLQSIRKASKDEILKVLQSASKTSL